MSIQRSNQLRSFMERVAASGIKPTSDEIKGLPIVPDTPLADVWEMREGVAKAGARIAAVKARGANAEARRIAREAAQEWGHLVEPFRLPPEGDLDPDEHDPRKLASAIVHRLL